MSLRIGFFSLKSGAGCTALAAHTANFLATGGAYSVALVERVANGQDPEYRRLKAAFDPDGTCRINNVRCYPADSGLEPSEDVEVYDFGVINFMSRFPEGMHKLYICTTGEPLNIPGIIKFRDSFEENQGEALKFDIVLFGASKEQFNTYKQHSGLSFASTVTMVPDRKEERLDYNFAMKIQNLFRISGCGLIPPVYDGKAEYEPMSFYTREEYKRLDGGCLFSIPEFKAVPEPTERKGKDDYLTGEDTGKKQPETEKFSNKAEKDSPGNGSMERKMPAPKGAISSYADGISAPGLLGEIIEEVKHSGDRFCCLFIVTKPPERLFVFSDMGVFFDKIGILMRELNASDDISFAVLTHRDGGTPEIIGGEGVPDPYGRIRLLDADIRAGTEINERVLKEHMELASFEEVLYPS